MKWNDWRPTNPKLVTAFEVWREGRLEEALALFSSAVTADEGQADAWRGQGGVLWSLGRFEEAAAAFRKAVALDCWNPMHWHNLGLAYRDLRRFEDSIRMLRFSGALDPKYEPAYNEWANVLVDLGRHDEALRLYDQALSLDEGRAVVHHNRGVCLRLMGNFALARESFAAALRRDPGYHHTLSELERMGDLGRGGN
jgi:tetratricopeptide (TPR) repeat protein